jgi:hypothetical protein
VAAAAIIVLIAMGFAPGRSVGVAADRDLAPMPVGLAPVAPGTIGVVSSAAFLYDVGGPLPGVSVVGEVLSLMDTRRESVVVTGQFFDGATLLGSVSDIIFLSRLGWGAASPFVAFDATPGFNAALADSVSVSVTNPGTPVTAPPTGALSIIPGPTTVDGLLGARHFTGTIHNPNPFEVELAAVAITTLDGSGSVIDVGWGPTSPEVIIAGASATYDVSLVYDPTVPVARSLVSTDAWQSGTDNYVTEWDNFFDDLGATPYRSDISWIAEQGITLGCGAARFCPDPPILRDQMASFLARAVGLEGIAPNAFIDDEGNIHEFNINLVAQAGVTTGCGVDRYCPDGLVTRAQMAAFLHRAFG